MGIRALSPDRLKPGVSVVKDGTSWAILSTSGLVVDIIDQSDPDIIEALFRTKGWKPIPVLAQLITPVGMLAFMIGVGNVGSTWGKIMALVGGSVAAGMNAFLYLGGSAE